jgi:hypothetical protein
MGVDRESKQSFKQHLMRGTHNGTLVSLSSVADGPNDSTGNSSSSSNISSHHPSNLHSNDAIAIALASTLATSATAGASYQYHDHFPRHALFMGIYAPTVKIIHNHTIISPPHEVQTTDTSRTGNKVVLLDSAYYEYAGIIETHVRRRQDHNVQAQDSMCKPMAEWQTVPRPNCNAIHEVSGDMLPSSRMNENYRSGDGDTTAGHNGATLLGTGGWRGAWKFDADHDDVHDDSFVLKTIK